MTANKHVAFQVRWSNAETEATTWSIADTDYIVNPLERKLFGITVNQQMQFKKELSFHLVEFEAWWKAICVHSWKSLNTV